MLSWVPAPVRCGAWRRCRPGMDLSRFACGRSRRPCSDAAATAAAVPAPVAPVPAAAMASASAAAPPPPPPTSRKRPRPSSPPAAVPSPAPPHATATATGTAAAAAAATSSAEAGLEGASTPPLPLLPAGGGPGGGRWREKYATPGHAERPLRLLLVGHNPSAASWAAGHGYAHGGNRLWRLLRDAGVVPAALAAAARDGDLPAAAGVGLTDVWLAPGSDAAAVRRAAAGTGYRDEFFGRLAAHAARASAVAAAEAAADAAVVAATAQRAVDVGNSAPSSEVRGVTPAAAAGVVEMSQEALALAAAAADGGGVCVGAPNEGASTAGEPAFVAFTGKSHFVALFAPAQRVKSVPFGEQAVLPAGWPLRTSRVWVLPSPSGRAALTDADRSAPYAALGRAIAPLPWPHGVGEEGRGGRKGRGER